MFLEDNVRNQGVRGFMRILRRYAAAAERDAMFRMLERLFFYPDPAILSFIVAHRTSAYQWVVT